MDLKTRLKNIPEDASIIEDLDFLIEEMLEQIGHTDEELRDQLIYRRFGQFILNDFIQADKLKHILAICLDDQHLFCQLGERDTDNVFTRSFSSLVIVLVLLKDIEERFLLEAEWEHVYRATINYLQKEQDTRGYIEGKGWAHSIAHGADLLATLVKHPFFKEEYIQECLEAIACCVGKEKVFIDDEDERLIFAIEAMLEKGLDEQALVEWMRILVESVSKMELFSLRYFQYRTNISNFIKSLYFRLAYRGMSQQRREEIVELMEKLHSQVYQ